MTTKLPDDVKITLEVDGHVVASIVDAYKEGNTLHMRFLGQSMHYGLPTTAYGELVVSFDKVVRERLEREKPKTEEVVPGRRRIT